MVDDECNDLFEEYKEDWEFEDSNAMDTPLRKFLKTNIPARRIAFRNGVSITSESTL
jgi:hypothetical protein